jgi:hypothetical protein
MIPSAVSGNIPSAAERKVFELLKSGVKLAGEGYCLHSLNISEHEYKLVGELDFVIVCPSGVFVLEVKGGGVSCRDGVWTFRDRKGREHRTSEGPFQQARSGMFSLRARLAEHFGEPLVKRLPFGYGVVFPDCEFDLASVEWSAPMVLDARDLRTPTGMTKGLTRLMEYWVAKRDYWEPSESDQVGRITRFLRPDFDRVPSLRSRAEDIDRVLERLTDEQYAQLDVIEDNPRILCTGGAGTGKTFLACEIARRFSKLNQRVLITCRSGVLAAFIRSRVGTDGIEVQLLSSLPSATALFDVLIADEAQDLMNFADLGRLDGLVKSGLGGGTWRLFYDPNKQIGLEGAYDPEAVELLRGYGAVSAALHRNCRNTTDIVLQTKLWSGSDPGAPHAGSGPPVEYRYFVDRAEQRRLVEAHLARLAGEGVGPGDVTLLTLGELGSSVIRDLRGYREGRITEVSPEVAAAWPRHEMTAASVADFKGMENRFILLTDIYTQGDEDLTLLENRLYVGMTRARAGLWMAVDRRLEAQVAELQRRHLDLAMRDVRSR